MKITHRVVCLLYIMIFLDMIYFMIWNLDDHTEFKAEQCETAAKAQTGRDCLGHNSIRI